ncbi:unnamed protein product [Microthlaspi erraticum]|uniref:Uncharacterized protein n=1 Tax=Microthlaspi erraticum TaxID=1685480 RepID=A0A6D2LHW4_9BRAS|nr:unnamed protein product [Microthlaspi erraticum]
MDVAELKQKAQNLLMDIKINVEHLVVFANTANNIVPLEQITGSLWHCENLVEEILENDHSDVEQEDPQVPAVLPP